jgi:hypothetical protein
MMCMPHFCRLLVLLGLCEIMAAQSPSFDNLADADREVLGDRFRKEIWPLLVRGDKDGCVGCHAANRNNALRFAGDDGKDFRMLLREGFFLKDDPGSLLARLKDADPKRRMPPAGRRPWTEAEKKVLSDFVHAVHAKQRP